MRTTLSTLFLVALTEAIKLVPSIPDEILAQTETEGGYGGGYGGCDDDCPIDEGTGITQLPGPNSNVIRKVPLEYNNHGWMHTDWEHHIDISQPKGDYYDGGDYYNEPYGGDVYDSGYQPVYDPYTGGDYDKPYGGRDYDDKPYGGRDYDDKSYGGNDYDTKPYGGGDYTAPYGGGDYKKKPYVDKKYMYGNGALATPVVTEEEETEVETETEE